MKYAIGSFVGALVALVAAVAFGAFLAGCLLPGYVDVPPMEAQRMERRQCDAKTDAEERRACHSLLDKKWARYNGEGGYPADPRSGTCGGSEDCRGK